VPRVRFVPTLLSASSPKLSYVLCHAANKTSPWSQSVSLQEHELASPSMFSACASTCLVYACMDKESCFNRAKGVADEYR
jgi:hypothetical protein